MSYCFRRCYSGKLGVNISLFQEVFEGGAEVAGGSTDAIIVIPPGITVVDVLYNTRVGANLGGVGGVHHY